MKKIIKSHNVNIKMMKIRVKTKNKKIKQIKKNQQ
jgi:hypothetical protein